MSRQTEVPLRKIIILVFAVATTTARAESITFYVAPHGNDAWSGLKSVPRKDVGDGPLATLQGARDAIRRARPSMSESDAIRVIVAGGEYVIKEPLLFGPADGGKNGGEVVYQAAAKAKPLFVGGDRISGFIPYRDGIYVANVADFVARHGYFDQLFVNNRRAIMARTPNVGSWFFLSKSIENPLVQDGAFLDMRKFAFYAEKNDVATLKGVDNRLLHQVGVVMRHSWATTFHKLKSVDFDTGRVMLSNPAMWDFLTFGKQQGYFFENYFDALDAEGEWYLDRQSGCLYYMPRQGESMENADVVVPLVDKFIIIQGDPSTGSKVRNLSFRGLTFRFGNRASSESGFDGNQAAVSIPAIIEVDWGDRIAVENCAISQIGVYGVWLHKGVTNSRVAGCVLDDLGAGGIRVGDEVDPVRDFDASYKNHIENNLIKSIGQRYEGAVGIWVGQSSDNVVAHNEISDTGYSGISVGWQWGFSSSAAKRNVIEFNSIHGIGRGVLSDMGGVYTLGPSEGTVIRNNVIKDIRSFDQYGYGGFGIYLDEGSSGVLIENNLVVNAKTGGFYQHFGRSNIVRNNIFAFSQMGQIQHVRVVKDNISLDNTYSFTNNITYWNNGPFVYGEWDDAGVLYERNIYYYSGRPPAMFDQGMLDIWQASGRDKGSVYQDPGFINPSDGNFMLRYDTVANKVGFKPFAYQQAGIKSINP